MSSRSLVRAAPKEKNMKRTISLWLGLLAFALLPVLAQTPTKPTGKIHGHVTAVTGAPEQAGTVSLSTDGGHNSKYTFTVSSSGDYTGEANPGTYTVVFRAPETPADKIVDSIDGVKVIVGQDVLQDIDMSRKEFIEKNLSSEQKKQLEEIKKNASKDSEIVKNLNADLKTVVQDFSDADHAHAAAVLALGAAASRDDVSAKETEIKTAKYTDAETLMLKDTAAKADASVLWAQLGQAQLGLARTAGGDQTKFAAAETSFKKALEVEATAKKPSLSTQGAANSGLGEIYARTGKVPEANAAYDAAAKANPASAGTYLGNEAVIFVNAGNGDAAAAAADEAIKADPTLPLPYYLKGQGLIQKATLDPAGKMILPPGCAEAYQKYIELAPTGQFVPEVKAILAEASQIHNSAFGDTTTKKKKGSK